MKRVLALAAVAVLVPGAPAQAAPKDPVRALEGQFADGRGVKFTDTATLYLGGNRKVTARRTGAFRFGASGTVAADLTGRLMGSVTDVAMDLPEGSAGLSKPERVISMGKTSYISGGFVGEFMPEGKTWLKRTNDRLLGITSGYTQLVNVTEPKTLKALLATGKPSRGAHSGEITFGELYRISPWFRHSLPVKRSPEAVVTWKLQVGSDGLAQRLTTSYPATAIGYHVSGLTMRVDTRFTGWGAKVSVKAPPSGRVTAKLDTSDGDIPTIPLVTETE
ncbi:hypothetical protein ACFXJ8_12435 [Nonomuraea sp. NPDC059194]|uniref:hypothetical protein n=1 Tax=Nonomuraea sp. NPDC059194 TaxID=3346764 RepID=UPI0036881AA0